MNMKACSARPIRDSNLFGDYFIEIKECYKKITSRQAELCSFLRSMNFRIDNIDIVSKHIAAEKSMLSREGELAPNQTLNKLVSP